MAKPSLARCAVAPAGRRRVFWTTNMDCGSTPMCPQDVFSDQCGVPGLTLVDVRCDPLGCHDDCATVRPPTGRTIDNSNWVDSLIINILMTDARRDDTACGHLPGRRGGHWSDSYRRDQRSSGSKLRYIDPNCSIANMTTMIEAAMNDDLQRLVDYGVVRSITVTVSYRGRNMLHADITYVGERGDSTRVGLAGAIMKNSWAWSTQRAA